MISARRELGVVPIVEGQLTRRVPLFAERYLSGHDQRVSASYGTVMIVHFGGSRVEETDPPAERTVSVPSRILLLAPRTETRWHYSGVADFGIFYFPEHASGIVAKVKELAKSAGTTLSFTDALVSAAALAIFREFEKGPLYDERFAIKLAEVMLEQTARSLSDLAGKRPSARPVHLARLEATFNHIRQNVAADLSIETLASRVGVSVTHFRRLFREATGTPPHKFILAARLAHARELLTMTSVPIASIALESGFANQSHLTRALREKYGVTPAQLRLNTAKTTGTKG